MNAQIPKRFSDWDEDELRERWIAGIPARLNAYRPEPPEEPTVPVARSSLLWAVADHLTHREDTRMGLAVKFGVSDKTIDRILLDLKTMGKVTRTPIKNNYKGGSFLGLRFIPNAEWGAV